MGLLNDLGSGPVAVNVTSNRCRTGSGIATVYWNLGSFSVTTVSLLSGSEPESVDHGRRSEKGQPVDVACRVAARHALLVG